MFHPDADTPPVPSRPVPPQYSGCKPRHLWEMWHPTLVAEAVFAIANIFSSLRLISLFTANSHLGPLQISLGRMLLDILKFLFIYCLVGSHSGPSADAFTQRGSQ